MIDPPTPRHLRNRLRDLPDDGPEKWPNEVEIAGIPATDLDDDGLPVEDDDGEDRREGEDTDERPSRPSFTISIMSDGDGEDDGRTPVGECECGNPIFSDLLDGECVVCAGMPRRDWPEEIREAEGVE
jgi:hypothetical protein